MIIVIKQQMIVIKQHMIVIKQYEIYDIHKDKFENEMVKFKHLF